MMGVGTQGFTLTDNKDVFDICTTIDDALKSLPRTKDDKPVWPDWRMMPGLHHARAEFEVNGEGRILWVFFRHDSVTEPEGPKVIYNLGCWGSSELIVTTVCRAMLKYGRTFYQYSDCSDDEPVEILPEPELISA